MPKPDAIMHPTTAEKIDSVYCPQQTITDDDSALLIKFGEELNPLTDKDGAIYKKNAKRIQLLLSKYPSYDTEISLLFVRLQGRPAHKGTAIQKLRLINDEVTGLPQPYHPIHLIEALYFVKNAREYEKMNYPVLITGKNFKLGKKSYVIGLLSNLENKPAYTFISVEEALSNINEYWSGFSKEFIQAIPTTRSDKSDI